ncbi:hypothetical protein B0H11DRAFT_2069706, partial [Mycena galericulata]
MRCEVRHISSGRGPFGRATSMGEGNKKGRSCGCAGGLATARGLPRFVSETKNRGWVGELRELSGSGGAHQTGETSLSDSSSTGGGGCVFAKTVKFAVVRRGRWGRAKRTRRSMGDAGGGAELAARDSAADVRAGRGGEGVGCLVVVGPTGCSSVVMHAVGYWGVRMRLDGDAKTRGESGGVGRHILCPETDSVPGGVGAGLVVVLVVVVVSWGCPRLCLAFYGAV